LGRNRRIEDHDPQLFDFHLGVLLWAPESNPEQLMKKEQRRNKEIQIPIKNRATEAAGLHPEVTQFNGWTSKNATTASARNTEATHQGLISALLFI
jgi:hypothetical protein